MRLWRSSSTATQVCEPDSRKTSLSSTASIAPIDLPGALPVPEDVTIQNLSGVYTLNHALSDSSQSVLKMQRINFVVRQAVAYSTVDVTLKQYTTDDGAKHLDQEQLSTGGIRNFEDRVMDWVETEKYNWIWGQVNGKSRYTTLDQIEDEYLKDGWSQDTVEGEVVEGYVESKTDTWIARQIWGFADVDGQRRHVRKILAQKPGWEDLRVRMVYDWKSEAA